MSKTQIALSMGGNMGDVAASFDNAVGKLKQAGLSEVSVSGYYITTPVGCSNDTDDFLNAALTGIWQGTKEELFRKCKKLEEEAGRPGIHPRFASRPLDLDIIFFGDLEIKSPQLTIPHPEASNRLFVLIPLADIAPDWRFPGKNYTVKELLETFPQDEEYNKISSAIQREPKPFSV